MTTSFKIVSLLSISKYASTARHRMVEAPFGSTYRAIQVIWIMWNKSTCLLRVALTLIVWTGSPAQTCQANQFIQNAAGYSAGAVSPSHCPQAPFPQHRETCSTLWTGHTIINLDVCYRLFAQIITISLPASCRKAWFMNKVWVLQNRSNLPSVINIVFIDIS